MSRQRVPVSLVAIVLALAGGVTASAADASLSASAKQSRQMWRAADPNGRCKHRRARVSHAASPTLYGLVTIADSACGNGRDVLRRSRGRWRVVGRGSDWEDPARCSSDRRIPLAVRRDFFGRELCR